jgi:serine/threonine protein kinase
MRVYAGGSVRNAIESGHRFSIADTIEIVQHVTSALSYLHVEKGYLHRDIKPGNVFLDAARRNGYLGDFGSAARLDPATGLAATVRTTPLYQAPEAAMTGRIGPLADIYALGLTAFEMLNGLFPYGNLDAAEVDRRINSGQRSLPDRMLAPGAFAPHVPNRLIRVIRRMLDRVEGRRQASAAEVGRDLRALQCVDWRHDVGDQLDGEWSGRWPPRRRLDRQIELRATSSKLGAGPHRGRHRLAADYRTSSSGGWRTVGVQAVDCDPHDAAAVSAFFRAVDDQAARRWPA